MMRLDGYSRERCRELDRSAIEEAEVPSLLLMEHASLGTAELAVMVLAKEATAEARRHRIWVLAGPGNNGGDGYAVARHLSNAGADVVVWDLVDPDRLDPETDSGRNRRILTHLPVTTEAAASALPESDPESIDLIVDAIFGTGLSRPPEGRFADAIERINAHSAPVLAVDIPSGLDANHGRPLGRAVEATATATFGLVKKGFRAPGAGRFTGDVWCVPIGVPRHLLPPGTPAFPPRPVPADDR